MKIKASYDKREDIPAGYEELYTETDGKWLLTGVEGVRTDADVARVQRALTAEKEAHKTTKGALDKFTGAFKTPEEALAAVDRIGELETELEVAGKGGGLDDPKIQELVDKRAATKTAPLQRELQTVTADRDALKGENEGLKTSIAHGKIREVANKAAAAQGVVPTAVEDIEDLALRVFEVAEDGTVVTRDGVGATPGITPEMWLSDMKEKRPHWWPASVGGGLGGGDGGKGVGGNNPWSPQHWNATAQGAYIKEHGIEKANLAAKRAGSFVGATEPVKQAAA